MRRRALLLTAITVAAFGLRLAVLWTDEPLGTDGYYYVVQIEDLVSKGHLHVPDGSWTLRLLALPHALGASPIASLALMASLLTALVVPAAAWAWPRSCTPAILLAASPTLTHLAGDFPKSLGLAAPLIVLVGAMGRGSWALATGAALLCATAHRLGAVFALLVITGALLARADRRTLIGLGLVAASTLGFVAVAALVPGWLHPDDLHRLDGQLRAIPWPPAPFAWPRTLPLVERLELCVPWLALLAIPTAWRTDRATTAALLCGLLPVLFPFWRADTLDLGYRLALWGPLLAWPLVALALPERPRGWALLLLPASLLGFDPTAAPPYAVWRDQLDRIPEPLPTLLITQQGMNFLYDHRTGREAMAWAPEPELDRRTIGRVVWGIRPGEWAAVAGPEHPDVVPLGPGYAYVREDLWEALLDASAEDPDLQERIADPRNPTRVRPAALIRGR